jgi:YggT family protein
MDIIITIIIFLVRLLSILIIVHVGISYFLSPYHPIREMLARFIEPMLRPIRRYVTPVNGIDFSPLVLLLLIQVIGTILVSLLRSL